MIFFVLLPMSLWPLYFVAVPVAKLEPMKHIMKLYRSNPVVALVLDCIAFLVWATTLIFVITILTVAFTC